MRRERESRRELTPAQNVLVRVIAEAIVQDILEEEASTSEAGAERPAAASTDATAHVRLGVCG
jgi:hypothetical protein